MKSLFRILFLTILLLSAHVKAESYPLNEAVRSQNLEQVKRLLASGVGPNETNEFGSSALSGAVGMCEEDDLHSIKIAQLLVQYGADVDLANDQGLTPVSYASFMGCTENVLFLIKHDADIFLRTSRGITSLMNAVSSGNPDTVELLLEAGANPLIKSRAGYDSFYLAETLDYKGISQLLESYREANKKQYVYNYIDCSESKYNFSGIESRDGVINKCYEDSKVEAKTKHLSDTLNSDVSEIFINFLITWTIIILPVLLVRLFSQSPLTRFEASVLVAIFFLINLFIFAALGSQSKSHAAVLIGAILSYKILRKGARREKDIEEKVTETALKSNFGEEERFTSSNNRATKSTNKLAMFFELSKNKKLFIGFVVFWFFWVTLRTFHSFEFLGLYMNDWSDDAFFVNFLVPPVLILILGVFFKWLKSSK